MKGLRTLVGLKGGSDSASSFWRREVALSKAAWFFAISDAKFLISVFRRALVAVSSSIVEVRSVMRASASAMAAVFSLSFVSHLASDVTWHDPATRGCRRGTTSPTIELSRDSRTQS